MPGFGAHHATEAMPGALPVEQNSPQRPPFGLYAEQVSGTAFTAPRHLNRRSWLYRRRPSVAHIGSLSPIDAPPGWKTAPLAGSALPARPARFHPFEPEGGARTFPNAVRTLTLCGSADAQTGMATHWVSLAETRPGAVPREAFVNADAEMLYLPVRGGAVVQTELGTLKPEPGDALLLPRNVKFAFEAIGGPAEGYLLENYGAPLVLPERGPLGANSLADERHFLYPPAALEDGDRPCRVVLKRGGQFFAQDNAFSPFDVAAWHGNHAPWIYPLSRFATVGSISFDHPDPSIFTVLTSPSAFPGTANIDFVIFPERWLVAEHTFRPPWFHINCMSEFMGLVSGVYDAKPTGFRPGGWSLHNAGLPHGPDAKAHAAASASDLAPEKLGSTLAFMWETRLAQHLSPLALDGAPRDTEYTACWDGLPPADPAAMRTAMEADDG